MVFFLLFPVAVSGADDGREMSLCTEWGCELSIVSDGALKKPGSEESAFRHEMN